MGLKRVFFRFFMQLLLSFAGISLICVILLFLGAYTGVIQPANVVERQVTLWIDEVNNSGRVSVKDIPDGAQYALFDRDMSLISDDMDEKGLDLARQLAESEMMVQMNASFTTVYKKLVTDSQIVIVRYNIRASFRNPFLAKICPNAELFYAILFLCLLLADIVWLTIRHARKLERELKFLQDAATQIKDQNLDFEIRPTKIKEFNKVLDSLNILKEELKESLLNKWSLEQQQREQMSALAHDIKTPLTILRGNAELLEESRLDEEQKECVNDILANTNQIQEYAAQIIDVSKQKIISYSSKEPCDLPEFLENLEIGFKNLGRDKNLCLQIERKTGFPEVIDTNKDGLKRVLWNILDNAAYYSPQNGTVTLSLSMEAKSKEDSVLIFRIWDEGEGFSEEALKYATTDFYRSDKSRDSREHFGMGLAIAKQILSQLGGELKIANRQQGGAFVEVCLYRRETI